MKLTIKPFLLTNAIVLALLLAVGVGMAAPQTIELDLAKPEHVALLEQALPIWPFSVEDDPFGNPALFFPVGSADMAPPAGVYPHMRFAVLDVPDVDDFEFSLSTIGVGAEHSNERMNGGNRSLSLVFGYQDPGNWWVVYYAYTNSTRVARMVDGVQEPICWPRVEDAFWPNNERYQNATIRLTTEGGNKVLRAYLNDEPTVLDLCTFPSFMYEPGKVGMGGHSTSTVQSWFFNDIKLDVLN